MLQVMHGIVHTIVGTEQSENLSSWESFAALGTNQRKRFVLVLATVLVVVALLYVSRNALFPFMISGVAAYILFPAVKRIEGIIPFRNRYPHTSRVVAITVIYVVTIGIIAATALLIVPPAFRQSGDFVSNLPEFVSEARQVVESTVDRISREIPEDLRNQVEQYAGQIGNLVIGFIQGLLTRGLGVVANTLTFVLGLAITPVLLFYLLKDDELIVRNLFTLFPGKAREHCRAILEIANRSLGSYVRAQLTLMLFVGAIVFIGLFILNIEFAVLLGLTAGITEAIPVVGPILGAIPGILVTLATAPEKLLWVILIYTSVQLIENSLLVPRIQGNAVGLHPAMIMALLIIASETFGLVGVIAVVPAASIARDSFKYFYEQWSEERPLETIADTELQQTTSSEI